MMRCANGLAPSCFQRHKTVVSWHEHCEVWQNNSRDFFLDFLRRVISQATHASTTFTRPWQALGRCTYFQGDKPAVKKIALRLFFPWETWAHKSVQTTITYARQGPDPTGCFLCCLVKPFLSRYKTARCCKASLGIDWSSTSFESRHKRKTNRLELEILFLKK